MPEVAKLVELVIGDKGSKLVIDGEEFPWHITSDGLKVVSGGWDDINFVEMRILAERTEVRFEDSPTDTEESAENEEGLADWEKELLYPEFGQVGDKFTMHPELELPDSVLVIKEVDSERQVFGVQRPDGWYWVDSPADLSSSGMGPHDWSFVRAMFNSRHFEIVNVK